MRDLMSRAVSAPGTMYASILLFFHQRGNPIGAIYLFGTWQGAIEFKLDLAGSCHVEKERRRYTDRSHPQPRDLR